MTIAYILYLAPFFAIRQILFVIMSFIASSTPSCYSQYFASLGLSELCCFKYVWPFVLTKETEHHDLPTTELSNNDSSINLSVNNWKTIHYAAESSTCHHVTAHVTCQGVELPAAGQSTTGSRWQSRGMPWWFLCSSCSGPLHAPRRKRSQSVRMLPPYLSWMI